MTNFCSYGASDIESNLNSILDFMAKPEAKYFDFHGFEVEIS